MARNLKVGVGDEITLLGSGRDGSFAAGIVRVAGIFDSGVPDLDRGLSAVPLRWFQETFTMGDHGHAVVLSLADLAETARAVELIRKLAPPDSAVLDWQELQPGLKQAIQADLSSAWFMYAVLVVLVAFSVLNTQLMSVLERTREFGMVMALGIRPGRMAALVMLEATLMAALGLALGLLLGWAVAAWFEMNGFTYPGMAEMADRFNLPARIYPAVNPFTMMMGPAVVFLFSVLASLYPALRLFRLQPVQAMRAA
jgi:ABC-type lipoprotein release transport system permease subunit